MGKIVINKTRFKMSRSKKIKSKNSKGKKIIQVSIMNRNKLRLKSVNKKQTISYQQKKMSKIEQNINKNCNHAVIMSKIFREKLKSKFNKMRKKIKVIKQNNLKPIIFNDLSIINFRFLYRLI